MSGFLTNYTNNAVLDSLFGSVPSVPPPVLYIGLSTSIARKEGMIREPIASSYRRVAVPNDLEHFEAAVAGSKSNTAPIEFPAPTEAWGLIRSVFVADAAMGGNVLAMADLSLLKTIRAGDKAPVIAIGALFFSHT